MRGSRELNQLAQIDPYLPLMEAKYESSWREFSLPIEPSGLAPSASASASPRADRSSWRQLASADDKNIISKIISLQLKFRFALRLPFNPWASSAPLGPQCE